MFDPGLCDFRPSRMAPICVMSGGHLVSVSTSLQNVLEAAGLRDLCLRFIWRMLKSELRQRKARVFILLPFLPEDKCSSHIFLQVLINYALMS